MASLVENGEDAPSRAEREREADAREALRHLRNVLSVVRSLARRTADEVDTLEDFRILFDGRLAAFSRVQSAVKRDVRAGVDLGAIIGDELLSFGMSLGDGVELEGEDVCLTPRAAGLVALAMHEIVSDFAAGDAPRSARVVWSDDDGLDIEWIQTSDGVAGTKPLADWVRQAIAYELKGRVDEHRAGDELRRRIHLPRACYVRPA